MRLYMLWVFFNADLWCVLVWQASQALPLWVLSALHEEPWHSVPAHAKVQLVPPACQRDLQEGRRVRLWGEGKKENHKYTQTHARTSFGLAWRISFSYLSALQSCTHIESTKEISFTQKCAHSHIGSGNNMHPHPALARCRNDSLQPGNKWVTVTSYCFRIATVFYWMLILFSLKKFMHQCAIRNTFACSKCDQNLPSILYVLQ